MKNMTQNIQNDFFDIKTDTRILRIISAAKRACELSFHFILQEGGGRGPPPSPVRP